MVVVYYVISYKKLMRCLKSGFLPKPVRAWVNIEEAERFSKQTGRMIILRLKFPRSKMKKLEGHKGKAVYVDYNYPLVDWLKSKPIFKSSMKKLDYDEREAVIEKPPAESFFSLLGR